MNPSYSLRDYTPQDYDELMALWELTDLSGKARGDDQAMIEKTLQQGGKLILMFHEEILIGSSWITNDGRRLHLHHFGIHPLYQGKGLSHILVKESLAFARLRNMQIKLEVHRDNRVAVDLYKKYGFTVLGEYDVYIIRKPGSINLR